MWNRPVGISLKAEVEGAVHAMTELYTQHSGNGWRFLLGDAKTAFNMVNRVAALWNAGMLWLRCSRCVFNAYRGFARLVQMNVYSVGKVLLKVILYPCSCTITTRKITEGQREQATDLVCR